MKKKQISLGQVASSQSRLVSLAPDGDFHIEVYDNKVIVNYILNRQFRMYGKTFSAGALKKQIAGLYQKYGLVKLKLGINLAFERSPNVFSGKYIEVCINDIPD